MEVAELASERRAEPDPTTLALQGGQAARAVRRFWTANAVPLPKPFASTETKQLAACITTEPSAKRQRGLEIAMSMNEHPLGGDFKLAFGKHKGCCVSAVPVTYLKFLTDWNVFRDGDEVNIHDRVYEDIMSIIDNQDCYIWECSEHPELADFKIAGKSYYETVHRMLHAQSTSPSTDVLQQVCRFLKENDFEWKRFTHIWGGGGLPASVYMWAHQFDAVVAARQYVQERRMCVKCFKVMPSIGDMRANGSAHPDWYGRKLHKACFVTLCKEN